MLSKVKSSVGEGLCSSGLLLGDAQLECWVAHVISGIAERL